MTRQPEAFDLTSEGDSTAQQVVRIEPGDDACSRRIHVCFDKKTDKLETGYALDELRRAKTLLNAATIEVVLREVAGYLTEKSPLFFSHMTLRQDTPAGDLYAVATLAGVDVVIEKNGSTASSLRILKAAGVADVPGLSEAVSCMQAVLGFVPNHLDDWAIAQMCRLFLVAAGGRDRLLSMAEIADPTWVVEAMAPGGSLSRAVAEKRLDQALDDGASRPKPRL